MRAFSWDQVNAWRLRQHFLLNRADRTQMLDVVSRLGGVHAQVMSAAELALSARVDELSPADVQAALWQDRTLVKTWLFRGTLHLLTARDFPIYVGALSTLRHFRRASWLKYHGVTMEELDALLEGVRACLSDTGITREQLADKLAAHAGNPELRERLLSGWGMLLKPAAFRGDLAFGANEGQNVTFVRPADWIGAWEPVDPQQALGDVLRRFLATYAPATIDEFARWIGMEPADAKKVFKRLGDEIVPVSVEGWEAFALASSANELASVEPVRSVRLLPHFDTYTLAVAKHSDSLLDVRQRARVYRQQGWISPVVLVDGRMVGVWELDKGRSQVSITVTPFAPLDDEARGGIAAEAERLGKFLSVNAVVAYEE